MNNDLIIPQVIVGLGNPEPKYFSTRHNIGFTVVDNLATSWQLSWQSVGRFRALVAEGNKNGQKLRLVKPLTYMNLSGESVRAVINWHKLTPQSLLVVYDDMDLPLGKIRMRLSGSAGGHNGIKSIISHLGTQDFPRLRIGIGKSSPNKETISHVLGKFAPEETPILTGVFKLVNDAVEFSLREGMEKTMSLYNSKEVV